MKKFLTLDDIAPKGKTVLVRADLNVPMKDGVVSDATRITRLIPTLRELSNKGARVVILSHFGRPLNKEPSMSLRHILLELTTAYRAPVKFIDDCIGDVPKIAIAQMNDGDVLLLENVRYYAEEEKNDATFAKSLAELGDLYVNDAFSCAHRAHASTEGIAHLLPSYAGRLMEAELDALSAALEKPERPVVALVGGSKISTKLDLLNNLVTKIDVLVLGGGMANTFLAAQGHPVGKSLCERDMKEQALQIIETAGESHCKILLPIDGVMAEEFKENAAHEITGVENIDATSMMLDIGPATVKLIEKALARAKTVLWNGPLGAFETKPFDASTMSIAKTVAQMTVDKKLISVAGGGDTVAALAAAGVEDKMTYVSSAGGAFLEWLEGKTLPGVKALMHSAQGQKVAAG